MQAIEFFRAHCAICQNPGESLDAARDRCARDLASVQRGLSRMVTLNTGARVECIAESVDLMTGRPFLVIGGPVPFGVWPDELDWHSLTTDTQRADWCDSMQARGRTIPQHSPAARWLKGEPA